MTVYLSLADAPLDDYSVPDVGDVDELGDPLPVTLSTTLSAPLSATVAPPLVLPFSRDLSLGDVGRDVVGAKRAIWRASGLRVSDRFTPIFGPNADRLLRKFQKQRGLAADGDLGRASLVRLAPYFDRYAFLLYVGYPPGSSPRSRIVAYATWGYNHRLELHYLERRPMRDLGELEHLPEWEDCSEFATKAYKFAGAPDPSNQGFDGVGNTYLMRQHGLGVSLADALPGDLVHYDSPQHVAIYVGGGRVISHGSEIGPLLLPASYRPVAMVRRYLPAGAGLELSA